MRWLIKKLKLPSQSAGAECAPEPVARGGAILVVVARGRVLGTGMGGAGRSEAGRVATGPVAMGPIASKADNAEEKIWAAPVSTAWLRTWIQSQLRHSPPGHTFIFPAPMMPPHAQPTWGSLAMFPPQLVAQGATDRGGQSAGVPAVVVGVAVMGDISSLNMTIRVVGTLFLVVASA